MQINNIPYLYRILSNIQNVCLQQDSCTTCPFKDDNENYHKTDCELLNELSKAPHRMDIHAVCDIATRAIDRGYDI